MNYRESGLQPCRHSFYCPVQTMDVYQMSSLYALQCPFQKQPVSSKTKAPFTAKYPSCVCFERDLKDAACWMLNYYRSLRITLLPHLENKTACNLRLWSARRTARTKIKQGNGALSRSIHPSPCSYSDGGQLPDRGLSGLGLRWKSGRVMPPPPPPCM